MSKCNKTEDEEEYGPQPGEGGADRGAPLMDAMFAKQPGECPPPPPPPNGNLSCSNPDLVQVTFNKLGAVQAGWIKLRFIQLKFCSTSDCDCQYPVT